MNIFTFDNQDNLVYEAPLKIADFDIVPSGGGVLQNGVPYQTGGGGPGGAVLAEDYITIEVPLAADMVIGSADIIVAIDETTVSPGNKYFITFKGPGRILPDPSTFFANAVYLVYFLNVPDAATPTYELSFSTNSYSAETFNSEANFVEGPPGGTYNSYAVLANYTMIMSASWMDVNDLGLFMEVL